MNEEFLIEPTSFTNSFEFKYVIEKFGFYQGRFIGEFPSSWKKKVFEHISNLPDVEQKRVKTLLKNNESSLVPLGLHFEPSLPWLENAHQKMQSNKLSGVIAAIPNKWNYPTIDDVELNYLRGGHDVRIEASSKNFSKLSQRLLQLSNEIVLVDPYLKLFRDDCRSVLYDFLETAQQGKCRSFIIWARHNIACMKTKQTYNEMLIKNYQNKLIKGSQLQVKLVNDDASIEKMHPRLMLSKLGGFRFDLGFSEFDGRYVDIAILDKSTHDHHLSWYYDRDTRSLCDFDIIEEYLIKN